MWTQKVRKGRNMYLFLSGEHVFTWHEKMYSHKHRYHVHTSAQLSPSLSHIHSPHTHACTCTCIVWIGVFERLMESQHMYIMSTHWITHPSFSISLSLPSSMQSTASWCWSSVPTPVGTHASEESSPHTSSSVPTSPRSASHAAYTSPRTGLESTPPTAPRYSSPTPCRAHCSRYTVYVHVLFHFPWSCFQLIIPSQRGEWQWLASACAMSVDI